MKPKTTLALYILLALLMLVDFYLIFNVGNPNSLIRPISPNPDYDMLVTLGVSLGIAVLSFFVFRDRKTHPAAAMLLKNKDYVAKLRNEGKANNEIAASFLSELEGTMPVNGRTRRAVIRTLKEMEY